MKKIEVKPGTIVWGTHREEDLWNAFRPYLPEDADWTKEGDELRDKLADDELTWEEEQEIRFQLSEIINWNVFDYMNEIAPEGCYFGAHPGDGSDFGFWYEDIELPDYTDDGYPVFYIHRGYALCPECANDRDPEEKHKMTQAINWEDSQLYCDDCSQRIEAVYELEEEEEEAEAEETA